MKNKWIKVCPKCGSTDIVPDLSASSIAKGTIFNSYKCNSCGYSGINFIEFLEDEWKKIKNKIRGRT